MIRSLGEYAGWIVFGLACLALGGWLRSLQAPEWLQPDTTQHPAVLRPWMVEADCYSQLARVQRILAGQGLIQNHFKVENWPEGLLPSTTAPFDYVILLLYFPLKLFTALPLDWAGVLVSPMLWAALFFFWLFFRSREFTWVGRALLIAGSAALPSILVATELGRPRHQSLILVLMAVGLTAEFERWNMVARPRLLWSVLAGLAWGFACWTSLFEPAFVFTVLVLFNLLMRQRESPAMLITCGGVMLVALLLEGFHIFIPPPEFRGALANWLGTISEVRGLDLDPQYLAKTVFRTLSLLLVPVIGVFLWRRENYNRTDRLLVLLTIALGSFAFFQSRWVYYAGLGELFLVARFCQMVPVRWPQMAAIGVFLLGLINVTYYDLPRLAQRPAAQPSLQLLQVSRTIDAPGGILAPWWLSPGLLYFSGHPIVAGSSHCGISGIVASSQFYATTSWTEAEHILRARQVRWVMVADDPVYFDPLLNTSRQILGLPIITENTQGANPDASVAETLINSQYVPTWLRLRAVTQQLKLYEYVPSGT